MSFLGSSYAVFVTNLLFGSAFATLRRMLFSFPVLNRFSFVSLPSSPSSPAVCRIVVG